MLGLSSERPNPINVALDILARSKFFIDFYDSFTHFAQYGPTYQRIAVINKGTDAEGRDEVLVEVRCYGEDLEK